MAFALLVDSIGPDTQHHLYVGNHCTPRFLERPLKAICHYRWNEYQFKPQFLRQWDRIGDPLRGFLVFSAISDGTQS